MTTEEELAKAKERLVAADSLAKTARELSCRCTKECQRNLSPFFVPATACPHGRLTDDLRVYELLR